MHFFFVAMPKRMCYMESVASKLIAFRCAPQLLEKVTALAAMRGKSRSRIIVEAVRMFSRTLKARGGRIVPPYDKSKLFSDTNVDALGNSASVKKEKH